MQLHYSQCGFTTNQLQIPVKDQSIIGSRPFFNGVSMFLFLLVPSFRSLMALNFSLMIIMMVVVLEINFFSIFARHHTIFGWACSTNLLDHANFQGLFVFLKVCFCLVSFT